MSATTHKCVQCFDPMHPDDAHLDLCEDCRELERRRTMPPRTYERASFIRSLGADENLVTVCGERLVLDESRNGGAE